MSTNISISQGSGSITLSFPDTVWETVEYETFPLNGVGPTFNYTVSLNGNLIWSSVTPSSILSVSVSFQDPADLVESGDCVCVCQDAWDNISQLALLVNERLDEIL